MKIIFLDLDGPMSHVLTVLAYGSDFSLSQDTANIFNNICEASGAKIVFTSMRVAAGSDVSKGQTFDLCRRAGLDLRHVHLDWACRDTLAPRRDVILEWLARHPEVTHYVVVDDEKVNIPNFVRVNEFTNINLKQFERIAKKLDFRLIEAFDLAREKNRQLQRHNFSNPGSPDEEQIVFLDFDGTIACRRVWMATGRENTMDPFSLGFLGHICSMSKTKVVCTSTDVIHDSPENLKRALWRFEQAGFDIRHLHQDWVCRDTRASRREAVVLEWMSRHPEIRNYVVVDDGFVDLPNAVRVDMQNGILYEHYVAIAKKLGLDMSNIFREARKSTILPGQFILPFDDAQETSNQRLMQRGNKP